MRWLSPSPSSRGLGPEWKKVIFQSPNAPKTVYGQIFTTRKIFCADTGLRINHPVISKNPFLQCNFNALMLLFQWTGEQRYWNNLYLQRPCCTGWPTLSETAKFFQSSPGFRTENNNKQQKQQQLQKHQGLMLLFLILKLFLIAFRPWAWLWKNRLSQIRCPPCMFLPPLMVEWWQLHAARSLKMAKGVSVSLTPCNW